MASVAESDKSKNRARRRPNSADSLETTSANMKRDSKIHQDSKSREKEEPEEVKAKTMKRRPTKVGLNDTLRSIRNLVVEGQSDIEIQRLLGLNERTFYRYMAKIHQIDNALLLEQEKVSMAYELSVFRDRLLKTYQWFRAMADNKEINPSIRMEAQRNAAEVAWALTILKAEGPAIIKRSGFLDNLYHKSSYQRLKKDESRKSTTPTTTSATTYPSSSFAYNEEEQEQEGEKAEEDSTNEHHMLEQEDDDDMNKANRSRGWV